MAPGKISPFRLSFFSFLLLFLPAFSFLVPGPSGPGNQEGTAGKDLSRVLAALEGLLEEAGDPGDVKSMAAGLGGDPERIFAFVRDRIGFLPYRGALRGASGTLSSRRGNSLDQALLLAGLLRASGFQAVPVHGLLSPEEALSLAEKSLQEIAGSSPAQDGPAVSLQKAAALLGVPPARLQAWLKRRRKGARARREALLEEGARQGGELFRILEDAKIPHPPGRKALLKALAGIVRDHFWVRLRARKGWRDLDPVLPGRGAGKGKPLPAGLGPFAWKVRFKLFLRRESGGRSEDATLLEKRFPLSGIAGGGCYFTWTPQAGTFPPASKLLSMKPAERAGLWKRVKILRAELLVRGEVFPALPFDLQGKVYKADPYGAIPSARKLGGALAGKLGGVFGGGGKKKEKEYRFLGLRLALDVEAPGGGKTAYERILLPPSPEAGKEPGPMPAGFLALLFRGAPLSPGESFFRVLHGVTRNGETLRRIARGERRGLRLLPPLEAPEILLRFARERALAIGKLRSGEIGTSFLWDRPQIYGLKVSLWRGPGKERFFLRRGIDILENRLTPLPAEGKEGARASLALGVADTALEASLFPPLGREGRSLSAWTFLARATLRGGRPEVERTPGGGILVRWGPEAFWEVDPATWIPVGRVPPGPGQGMLEYAIKTRDVMSTLCQISNLASIFIAGDPELNKSFGSADRIKGYICAVVDGNLPAVYLNNMISDMTAGLWKRAADALAGLE